MNFQRNYLSKVHVRRRDSQLHVSLQVTSLLKWLHRAHPALSLSSLPRLAPKSRFVTPVSRLVAARPFPLSLWEGRDSLIPSKSYREEFFNKLNNMPIGYLCKLQVCINRNSPYSIHLIYPHNHSYPCYPTWLLIAYYLVSCCDNYQVTLVNLLRTYFILVTW